MWGLEEDRADMLRLLALVATGLGTKGLERYEPPSAHLAEALAGPGPAEDPEIRRLEIMTLADALGGEAG